MTDSSPQNVQGAAEPGTAAAEDRAPSGRSAPSNQHSELRELVLDYLRTDDYPDGWITPDEISDQAAPDLLLARGLWRTLEQLEAARNEVAREKARPGGSFDQWADYQRLSTTLAHAEDFIEHMDMSYRWAEWCEGRDPNPAKEPEANDAT